MFVTDLHQVHQVHRRPKCRLILVRLGVRSQDSRRSAEQRNAVQCSAVQEGRGEPRRGLDFDGTSQPASQPACQLAQPRPGTIPRCRCFGLSHSLALEPHFTLPVYHTVALLTHESSPYVWIPTSLSHDKSLILTKATSSVSYLFCQPAYQPCLPSDFTFPSFSLRHFCLFTFQPLPFPSLPLPTISPPSANQNRTKPNPAPPAPARFFELEHTRRHIRFSA